MNTIIRVFITCLMCISFVGNLRAQDQHWSCDTWAYEYDMTAYLTVAINGNVLEDLSDFEIAAFCGDECRGVATILTAENGGQHTSYAYIRIRSNRQAGEAITFKVYHKLQDTEMTVEHEPLSFQSQDAVGLPSNPMIISLTQIIPGDANSDGRVTTFDITKVVNYILTNDITGFNKVAADVNGDGKITTFDITKIVEIILNK